MNQLVNALILFMSLSFSLGRELDRSHDPGMAYGFDSVSLALC